MNKKGQFAILSVIFGLIVFVILWALFFGSQINYWAEQTIKINSLTGIEAFFMSYMNLWIFCGIMIGSMIFLYFGGNS